VTLIRDYLGEWALSSSGDGWVCEGGWRRAFEGDCLALIQFCLLV
jgi:hypothetical protein